MNVDKAKKRIEKQVKKGFNGYPQMALEYFGVNPDFASELVISFVSEEGAEAQTQKFVSKIDARDDETIQSTLVKIIERTNPSSVIQVENISQLS